MTDGAIGVLAGVVLSAMLAILICCSVIESRQSVFQAEAVERGFAQHNPKTGEWEWKECECE